MAASCTASCAHYEILVEVTNDDTVIVPADGPVMTKADLLRHQKIYQDLFKLFFLRFNKGYGPQDIIDERPLKDHEAELGEPAVFLEAPIAACSSQPFHTDRQAIARNVSLAGNPGARLLRPESTGRICGHAGIRAVNGARD